MSNNNNNPDSRKKPWAKMVIFRIEYRTRGKRDYGIQTTGFYKSREEAERSLQWSSKRYPDTEHRLVMVTYGAWK